MTQREVVLDVAAFMDSSAAHAIEGLPVEDLRALSTAIVSACYEDLGKQPRLLDGEDARVLLTELLPGRLRKKDPRAEYLPAILSVFLDHLEETAVVTQAYELRRGVEENVDAFLSTVRAGTNEPRARANERPVVHRASKLGRNDPCFCGSGRKFKKCHGKGG